MAQCKDLSDGRQTGSSGSHASHGCTEEKGRQRGESEMMIMMMMMIMIMMMIVNDDDDDDGDSKW